MTISNHNIALYLATLVIIPNHERYCQYHRHPFAAPTPVAQQKLYDSTQLLTVVFDVRLMLLVGFGKINQTIIAR